MIQQYLIFTLDETQYAVNVFQIQEVLEFETPQTIPCSSPLMLGIVRSRNTNISIIDLRKKFNLQKKTPDALTRIVVLEVTDYEDGVINLYGIVADSVLEVVEFDDEKIESLPNNQMKGANKFVQGVTEKDGSYVLFIDVNKVFSQNEINAFEGKDGTEHVIQEEAFQPEVENPEPVNQQEVIPAEKPETQEVVEQKIDTNDLIATHRRIMEKINQIAAKAEAEGLIHKAEQKKAKSLDEAFGDFLTDDSEVDPADKQNLSGINI